MVATQQPVETVVVVGPEDDGLVNAFYNGIYLDAFAHQVEPVEVWKHRLWSGEPSPYRLTIRIAGVALDDPARQIYGGIVYELYPRSRCGLLTYMVIAPSQRGTGLGRRLLTEAIRALHADGASAVFGEVSDPTKYNSVEAWQRVELFQRWGGRVVDATYVQPSLGEGLERDRALRLMMFPADTPLPEAVPGVPIAAFLREFYSVTEGAPPDDPEFVEIERGFAGTVVLRELRRS